MSVRHSSETTHVPFEKCFGGVLGGAGPAVRTAERLLLRRRSRRPGARREIFVAGRRTRHPASGGRDDRQVTSAGTSDIAVLSAAARRTGLASRRHYYDRNDLYKCDNDVSTKYLRYRTNNTRGNGPAMRTACVTHLWRVRGDDRLWAGRAFCTETGRRRDERRLAAGSGNAICVRTRARSIRKPPRVVAVFSVTENSLGANRINYSRVSPLIGLHAYWHVYSRLAV